MVEKPLIIFTRDTDVLGIHTDGDVLNSHSTLDAQGLQSLVERRTRLSGNLARLDLERDGRTVTGDDIYFSSPGFTNDR